MAKRRVAVVERDWNAKMEELHAGNGNDSLPCFENPGPYQDFARRPTPEEAEALCEGCPILRLCREYGEMTRGSGVWGGKLLADGKRVYADEEYVIDLAA